MTERAIDWEALIAAALQVRQQRPRALFGLAVRGGATGQIGTNSCRLQCGERLLWLDDLCRAVSRFRRRLRQASESLSLSWSLGKAPPLLFPCGACRQVLAEFCDDLPILLVGEDGSRLLTSLNELLPHAFRLRTPKSR
jgi:hypothetical protein